MYGSEVAIGSIAMARCAPMKRAESETETVVMTTASSAMNEYPPFLAAGASTSGDDRSFESARNASLMKDEKDVKDVNEPQYPVARPM
ncbi:hypothetical protein DL769_007272 [Monosporascus sp. CRB-8-3]|nr:hypothetical protein DL769_007272 [Monosporascus sp. CRB-8-3]